MIDTINGIKRFMQQNKVEINKSQNLKRKELLSMSVVKRNAKVDTEKVLYDHLFPKYGERF